MKKKGKEKGGKKIEHCSNIGDGGGSIYKGDEKGKKKAFLRHRNEEKVRVI